MLYDIFFFLFVAARCGRKYPARVKKMCREQQRELLSERFSFSLWQGMNGKNFAKAFKKKRTFRTR